MKIEITQWQKKEMKRVFIVGFVYLLAVLSSSCKKENTGNDMDTLPLYIKSIEVVQPVIDYINVDNEKKQIILEFAEGQDISQVTLLFSLSSGVELLDGHQNTLNLNLQHESSVRLKANDKIIVFQVQVKINALYAYVQKDFVISAFKGVPGGPNDDYQRILENTKRANLTHIETTFTSPSGSLLALNIADDIGLKVIVQDYSRFGGFQNSPDHIAETTEESVKEAIDLFGSYSSLDGYYIWDEPFLEQLSQVKRDMDLFRLYAPNKILHTATLQSYSPTYTWENGEFKNYIDDFVSIVKPPILCLNYYVFAQDVNQGISLLNSKMWKDMGYIRKKALENNIPFWFYVQLIDDILNAPPENPTMTVPKVAIQNYISLAFGVKGLSYYNTIDGIFDIQGNPNHLFDGISALNKDILTLGRVLLKTKSTKVYHTSTLAHGDYLNTLSDSQVVSSAPAGLFIGEFSDSSALKYLMLVNTDYVNEKSGIITLHNNQIIHKINKINGEKELVHNSSNAWDFDIKAGEGELYVLSNN